MVNAGYNPAYRPVTLYYTNNSGEKGLTTYIYDNTGVMYKSVWHLMDMSRHSENYYKYNETGRLVEFYREFSDGLTLNEFYHYDEKGRKIKEFFFRSDGVKGTAEHFYDEKGRLEKTVCDKYKCWFTGIITYKHDKDGRIIEGSINMKGENAGRIEYKYDEHSNHTEEIWIFNSGWQQNFLYSYEPSDTRKIFTTSPFVYYFKNRKIKQEDYWYSDKAKGPSFYEYDRNGLLEKKIFKRSDGLTTETTYEYNDGMLITSQRKGSDNKVMDFRYTHDSRGNLTLREYMDGNNVVAYESFVYDKNDNLVKAVYRDMDYWLNGTITFTHDMFDRILKGHFEGKDMKADIEFKYDENGMVREILWKFGNGTEQGYTFIYE